MGAFAFVVIYKVEVDDEGLEGLDPTATEKYLARYLLLGTMGVIQGAICTVGDLILGVQTACAPLFILTGMITSLVYLSITYALSTTFMHIGKGLCVALVIVQIPGASGLYPIEMMPKFFRMVYPFVPFSYSIDAFRETIAGFYDGHWTKAIGTLLLFAAMALGSIAAGALWGFIPAWFKSRWNTNETLFTLMMNYVATSIVACMTNIMRGQASSLGTLNKATKAGWFPVIMGQRYTINIIVVIVLTFVMYAYLRFSKQGYEISVVGESENTARYAGINVRRVTVRTMLISGAICGLCGFLIVAGKDQTISTASANGRGFTAIIVAWLAKFNTFYMALISFLLVFLERGASEIASAYSLNEYAADIITGIILFFILGSEFFINYRVIPRGAHKEGK